jgi:hypothetical protein
MLWSLISSAYIIYLYRKLKAEREPPAARGTVSTPGDIDAELEKLNAGIRSLESRLASIKGRETAR